MHRARHLDGLRALAIVWVALYHYAWFWAPIGKGDPLLPYGDALSGIPLASVGFLGVYLFFIVSGIVITLSLERAATLLSFAQARFLRLWPTLLLCGGLTFAATSLLGPPVLQRSWAEAIISLSFVPPPYVDRLTGDPGMQWLDGAYWSLWTEVRFYAVTGLLYFAIRARFLAAWTVFATVSATIHLLGLTGIGTAEEISRLIFAEYQPYFSAGIALACLLKAHEEKLAIGLLFLSWLLAIGYTSAPADLVLIWGICFIFTLAICVVLRPGWLPFLAWYPVSLSGQASYSYYLLHQNFGLALLLALPVSGLSSVQAMLGIQIGLVLLSVVILRGFEQPLARYFKRRRAPRSAAASPA